jgi:tRNA nucleotidyltransferase (CCA-adding enzyme)
VRDLLLGAEIRDVDLVVVGDAAEIARAAASRLGLEVRAASAFGTCRIEAPGGLRVDVAMSRKETYAAPAALPRVEPAPIEEDLLRRDFTINSMAIRLDGPGAGSLLDPSGGRKDLAARRLRLHHPRSLADDPSRAFRGARYAARFGLRTAAGWREAVAAAGRAEAFRRLGAARLRREVVLFWSEPDPAAVLGLCSRWGILRHVHHRLAWTPALAAAVRRAAALRAGGRPAGPEVLTAILAWALPPRARPALARRLGIDGGARRRLFVAARSAELAEEALRRTPRGRALTPPSLLAAPAAGDPLVRLVVEATGSARLRAALREAERRWKAAEPALRGEDLLKLGVPRGPEVGAILRALRGARLRGRIGTPEEETAYVLSRVAARARTRPSTRG